MQEALLHPRIARTECRAPSRGIQDRDFYVQLLLEYFNMQNKLVVPCTITVHFLSVWLKRLSLSRQSTSVQLPVQQYSIFNVTPLMLDDAFTGGVGVDVFAWFWSPPPPSADQVTSY